ncbi:MAG: hypothetical protein IJ751_05960 [Oscillospiraceae bacterium]|nr:hypothetical protein [Oscillospiraceae bacterium]
MYTVIIQSQETARSGQDYRRLFFDEYIAKGEIDFCTWIRTGDSVDTAVPALYDLIAGKQKWRAIIVQTETDRLSESAPEARPENPFDFLENQDTDPYRVEESSVPLIRLTQMLGGIPEPEIRYDVMREPDEDGVLRIFYKPDRRQHRAEMARHRELSERYAFVENRPQEIFLISSRPPVDNTAQQIRAAWTTRLESESSEFWSRNKYPTSCRFITCDTLNPRHSLYPGSLFRLWTTVLLLAVNRVDASSLQAYRLYNARPELDTGAMSRLFSGYQERLDTMLTQLDAAEANLETVEAQAAKQAPKISEEVDVIFSSRDDTGLYINTSGLGLATDAPESEKGFWAASFRRAGQALHELLRAPMRALDVAAEDTRRRGEFDPRGVEILNPYQRADFQDDLERQYLRVLEARSQLGFNPGQRQLERRVIDEQVRRRIAQRVTRRQIGVGLGVALIGTLVGLLPTLVLAGFKGALPLLAGLGVVVLAMAVTAGACGVELWIQRREMADAMEDHNRCMHKTVREVQDSAGRYSEYLSALCSYLRGRSYLDQEEDLRCGRTNVAQLRRGHRRAIQRCQTTLRTWSVALGAPQRESSVERAFSFDPEVPPEQNPAYRMPAANGGREFRLNDNGETMIFPYSFVQGLSLEREELYDDVDSDSAD